MLSKVIGKCSRTIAVSGGLAVLLILVSIGYGYAAYRVQRPITDTGGVINQSYLWAEELGGSTHKGVDFSYGLGTDVYAVADGTVVNLRENLPNGDVTTAWGNFVLIQHDQFHYDRTYGTFGTLAYAYSMYLHLSQNSVRVAEGDHVDAGDWIAEVDDTGKYSSGHHLHLQIVIHSLPNRTLEPPPSTLDSENRSRNPEPWLAPFNYGGDQTGTVIGRVSDTNANPVANLRIYGLEKPAAAGGNVYEWTQTYSYDWANPDDILAENFGTTDVAPGTYHIVAKHYSGGQWVEYRDLGWHTVGAGETAFIGLYPVSLPSVRADYNGSNSTIVIRNNCSARTSEVNTTFFWPDGLAWVGRTDLIALNATVAYTPSSLSTILSPVAAASEDSSVVVETETDDHTERTNYIGILPDGSAGSSGWEQAGPILYAPLIKRNFGGRSSDILVTNTGLQTTTVFVTFYDDSGGESPELGPIFLNPHANHTIHPQENTGGCNATGTLCTAKISSSNGQPLAGVVREDRDSDGLAAATHNLFSAGASTLYVPVFKYNLNGMYSGVQVQNVGASSANITVRYYDSSGNHVSACDQSATGVAPYAGRTFANVACLGNGFLGSAVVSSSGPALVGMVSEASADGRYKKAYSAFLSGSLTAYGAPVYRQYKYSQDGYTWDAGIAVRNLSAPSATVNLYYYDDDGTLVGSQLNQSINIRGLRVFFAPVNDFKGSVRITANRDIAAIVNVAHNAGSGDTHAIYNASNR